MCTKPLNVYALNGLFTSVAVIVMPKSASPVHPPLVNVSEPNNISVLPEISFKPRSDPVDGTKSNSLGGFEQTGDTVGGQPKDSKVRKFDGALFERSESVDAKPSAEQPVSGQTSWKPASGPEQSGTPQMVPEFRTTLRM
jgi:hypothetical protein